MKQATMIMLTDNIGGYSQTICSREQMITPFVVVVVVIWYQRPKLLLVSKVFGRER